MCGEAIITFALGWIMGPIAWYYCSEAIDWTNGEEKCKRKKK